VCVCVFGCVFVGEGYYVRIYTYATKLLPKLQSDAPPLRYFGGAVITAVGSSNGNGLLRGFVSSR
jgi:hypothetical protein